MVPELTRHLWNLQEKTTKLNMLELIIHMTVGAHPWMSCNVNIFSTFLFRASKVKQNFHEPWASLIVVWANWSLNLCPMYMDGKLCYLLFDTISSSLMLFFSYGTRGHYRFELLTPSAFKNWEFVHASRAYIELWRHAESLESTKNA